MSCLEFKKGELDIKFKTPPVTKDISRVELVGNQYNARDKIFFSAGILIRGYSKQGKEFFKFDTNLTETIRSFGVEESRVWTASVI